MNHEQSTEARLSPFPRPSGAGREGFGLCLSRRHERRPGGRNVFLTLLLFLILINWAGMAMCAPKAELWVRWMRFDPNGAVSLDHSPWSRFLEKYLVTNHPSGIHLVRYGAVTGDDKRSLAEYINSLSQTRVEGLARDEQKAFWINLYNALTVKVVLDHYPVDSIRDINISPGLFSSGPWGKKLLKIGGEKVSLDDIEHRILRPVWNDCRIHYGLNCASLSCPNLAPVAYSAAGIEAMLETGARMYVNHPRGVRPENGRLTLSSIYKWFENDFGASREGVMRHLIHYAQPLLAGTLEAYSGEIRYEYDWSLNDAR